MALRKRIQLCRQNILARFVDALRETGAAVETVECLDECHHCESRAIGLVDSRMVKAQTAAEFVEKLKKGRR